MLRGRRWEMLPGLRAIYTEVVWSGRGERLAWCPEGRFLVVAPLLTSCETSLGIRVCAHFHLHNEVHK